MIHHRQLNSLSTSSPPRKSGGRRSGDRKSHLGSPGWFPWQLASFLRCFPKVLSLIWQKPYCSYLRKFVLGALCWNRIKTKNTHLIISQAMTLAGVHWNTDGIKHSSWIVIAQESSSNQAASHSILVYWCLVYLPHWTVTLGRQGYLFCLW